MLARCRSLIWVLGALLAWGIAHAQTAEFDAIREIRRDALANADGRTHPLPLAAHWNNGWLFSTGFGPGYQIEQIRRGQYILPWFGLEPPAEQIGGGYATPSDALYYEPAIQYLAQHHLPLSFETTQWEMLLPSVAAEYAATDQDGRVLPLSPFGPVEPYFEVGRRWAQHPSLRRLQKLYPDPPLVLFVSNNEYPKLTPNDLHANFNLHADAELIARRRAIGDAWIERYKMLLRGFREGLESPTWRANAIFVGYDAFMGPSLGRWWGWADYSLYVPGRTEPWPYAWDGASVSYYVHDWAPDSDFTVWGPEVEAMNWVAVLEEVRRSRPRFWFEISTWDGQEPGLPSDKRWFYTARGQELTPERYGGMVQFGMWLLRPRVVREFRNPEHDRIHFGPYFDAILAAVARVHRDPTLRDFWEKGRLLQNPVGGHPYQESLPAELASRARWFLLDSPANPPRPWELGTALKVFALALERGEKPHREWLVYAFSPLEASADVVVTIPGGPVAPVRAARAGAFTLVKEGEASVRTVGS